jgi:integrase
MVTRQGEVWYARLESKDAEGNRKQKWIALPGIKSKREAQREEARLKTEQAQGTFIHPDKQSVKGYLETWLSGKRLTVSLRTWETYKFQITRHIAPHVGQIRLTALSAGEVRSWLAVLVGKGLSGRSAGLALVVLKMALAQAVQDEVLLRNPAWRIKAPRDTRENPEPLTTEETAQLLERCQGEPLYPAVMLAIFSGMRRGEILALRWEDVSLETGTIHVQQSIEETVEAGARFKEPKTPESRRAIKLPSVAVNELRRIRSETGRVRGLIVGDEDGNPLKPTLFSQRFRRLLKRVGIRHIRFHDIRHSHATELFRAGFHPKMVSSRLGHSKVGITLDIYSHVMPGMDAEIVKHLDTAFLPNRAETGS